MVYLERWRCFAFAAAVDPAPTYTSTCRDSLHTYLPHRSNTPSRDKIQDSDWSLVMSDRVVLVSLCVCVWQERKRKDYIRSIILLLS